jgi:hypothetical protein
MSKLLKVVSLIAAVGLIAGVTVNAVYAQEETPLFPRGSRGPRDGGMGSVAEDGIGLFQIDQEAIHQELADLLGISLSELESALENGETLASLAVKYEVDFEELQSVMDAAHVEALDQAVADGTITQEQADWILERQAAMGMESGTGFSRQSGRGTAAFAQGAMGASGNCWSTTTE